MHTLAQRWLDVDIPTTTNPTMHRRWANVARPTITRRRAHSKCLRWPNVGSTSSFQPRPIRPCADVGPTLPDRPSPDVAYTQNAYVGQTLARRRHSDRDQAPTLDQRCPADHRPMRTLKMPTLAQRWLDVDMPTTTNPTMRRCWANVARPTITRRCAHSKCLRWPDVGSTSSFRPRPCADVARPTITRLRAHSKCLR